MPVILATQEAEIRRITVRNQTGQIVCETLSRKYLTQKVLVEWLKVRALISSPSTTKKKKKKKITYKMGEKVTNQMSEMYMEGEQLNNKYPNDLI
jgi:hypothetical protein